MANYSAHTCFRIEDVSAEEAKMAEALHETLQDTGHGQFDLSYLPEEDALFVSHHETCDLDHIGHFLVAFFQATGRKDQVLFEAAYTCSRARANSFGGAVLQASAEGYRQITTGDLCALLREGPQAAMEALREALCGLQVSADEYAAMGRGFPTSGISNMREQLDLIDEQVQALLRTPLLQVAEDLEGPDPPGADSQEQPDWDEVTLDQLKSFDDPVTLHDEDDPHAGVECSFCGDEIDADEGQSSPDGSMHMWCAVEHEQKHPEQW